MLTFDNISYTYHTKEGETTAVKDLSFNVAKGQFVSVIGPSGCGKTTILSLAARRAVSVADGRTEHFSAPRSQKVQYPADARKGACACGKVRT